MRHIKKHAADRVLTSPADYAAMSIEDAARLLARPAPKQAREGAGRIAARRSVVQSDAQQISTLIAAAVGQLNSDLTVILSASAIAGLKLPKGHPAQVFIRQVEAATRRSATHASKLLAVARRSGAASTRRHGPNVNVGDGI